MPFSTLGLTDQLVQGILATGYNAPTAIQSKAIPAALAGRDIIGLAQTGTGKTAAFMLPIIQLLAGHSTHSKHPRALVLVPTRELAQQVEDFATSYGRFTHLRVTSVYGGANMTNQTKRFQRGVDIVVATPGRLLDHLSQKTVDLSHVNVLVLDEADRMFDMGFIHDVRRIIAKVQAKRQTMLFSATMSPEIKELVASVQHDPLLIEIGEQRRPADTVQQHFYKVGKEQKLPLLIHVLRKKELTSVLVFTRTKHGADKISRRLERNGLRAVAIHSNRTQAQRERALAGFRNGQFAILVATDIAARGIDVEGISHVINFDTPAFAEDYLHRIGRTGRAESRGDALTFVSPDEVGYFRRIEQYTGKKFSIAPYPDAIPAELLATPKADAREDRQDEPRRERTHREGKRPSGEHRPHHPSSSRKPSHGNVVHRGSSGQRMQGPTRDRKQSERRGSSFPKSGNRTDTRKHQGPNRPQGPGTPPRGGKPGKQRVATPSTQPSNDWRKLMSEIDNKESFGKKLRKLFKRG
jgi:ATP-dependent RNA helicase RhlE